jgi:hypothetical protein
VNIDRNIRNSRSRHVGTFGRAPRSAIAEANYRDRIAAKRFLDHRDLRGLNGTSKVS